HLNDWDWQDCIYSREGVGWLLGLQNRDGGIPTFCRGWGKLPFDRSGCDLTAHTLRALGEWSIRRYHILASEWNVEFALEPDPKLRRAPDFMALRRALKQAPAYPARQQRPDGSWLPLWFGNQHAPDDENPTYGTARVLAAYRDLGLADSEPARRGVAWLL